MKIYQRNFNLSANDSLAYIAHAIESNVRVLDVGCGAGDLGAYLRNEKQCHVTGVEYSKESLDVAKNKLDQVIEANLETTALSQLVPGGYDVIVMADILEHIRNPDVVLIDALTLLNTGGKLLISIPNAGYIGALIGLYDDEWQYREEGILDTTHVRYYTKKSILALLNQCNYDATIINAVCKDLTESEFTQRIDCLAEPVRNWLLAKPEGSAYQFIVEARPKSQHYPFPQEIPTPQMQFLHVVKLYWQDTDEDFCAEKYILTRGIMGQKNTLQFGIATNKLYKLRLDFADRRSLYRIQDIRIKSAHDNNALWSAKQSETSLHCVDCIASDNQLPCQLLALDKGAQLIIDCTSMPVEAEITTLETDTANPKSLIIEVIMHAPISEQSMAFIDAVPKRQYDECQKMLQETARHNTYLQKECEQLNQFLEQTRHDLQQQLKHETQKQLALNAQIETLKTQTKALENDIASILQSTSWKITAPLRKLKK